MQRDSYFQRVYQVVRQIPPGTVATYGQIALLLGNPRSARAVGYAMRAAPPELPCHRVIKKNGELCADESFGPEQRARLKREGVPFLEDGRVDVGKCRWLG